MNPSLCQPDAYDRAVRELGFEMKAQPSDRMKTEEELAREEQERLRRLEVRDAGGGAGTLLSGLPPHSGRGTRCSWNPWDLFSLFKVCVFYYKCLFKDLFLIMKVKSSDDTLLPSLWAPHVTSPVQAERVRRMLGTSEDQDSKGPAHVSADDLNDGFVLDKDDRRLLSYKVRRGLPFLL